MSRALQYKKGFTLLEILLVVATIAILAGIVIIAINPQRQLAQLRNLERESGTKSIVDAVAQKTLDDEGLLANQVGSVSYYMVGTDATGCDETCGTTGQTSTSTTNSALNESSSASSTYTFNTNYTADRGNDGNASTFWLNDFQLGTSNLWWEVDFGEEKNITQIDINWFNAAGTYNCDSLSFQGSNNGSSYTTLHGPIDTSSDPVNSSYNFTPASYQYWRLFCGQGTNANFLVLREVEMFESIEDPATTETSCFDLGSELIPDYLTDIPYDPREGDLGNTGYAIKFSSGGRIEGRSCHAELNEDISLKK